MQNRRKFIKTSCTVCTSIIAAGLIATALNSCGTPLQLYKTSNENNTLSVPANSFTELNKILIVRSGNLEFDVLLIKVSETDYRALLMKCTHRDNPLTANDKGLYCSAHGSAFDLLGNVIKEPAQRPLKKFQTTLSANNILINLNS